MVRHNHMISKNHFHKDWKRWLRTNFGQVFQKRNRNLKRTRRQRDLAPTPIHPLQPIVHCPSGRYNSKQRLGRGFSLAEVRSVGLNPKEARSIGIRVDHRRRNKSYESLLVNKQRLQEYRRRLVIFPKGDKKRLARKEPVKEFVTDVNQKPNSWKGKIQKARVVTEEEKKFSAFTALRQAHGEIKKMRNKRKKGAKNNDII